MIQRLKQIVEMEKMNLLSKIKDNFLGGDSGM